MADILAFTFSKSVNMQKRANYLFCTGIIGEKGDFSERVWTQLAHQSESDSRYCAY